MWAVLVLLAVPAVAGGIVPAAAGQDASATVVPTETIGLDGRLFFKVHTWDSRMAPVWLGTADYSAYPVFAVSAPLMYVLGDRDQALSTGISLATAFAGAIVIKRLTSRDRPYARWPRVLPRTGYPGTRHLSPTASLPSGHAALAAALATSVALDNRSPWLIGGAVAWAGSVGISRIWLGVHHPGDVLAGTALGIGAGFAAHFLADLL